MKVSSRVKLSSRWNTSAEARIVPCVRAAFTLIELLTVIAIIGILAAITAPVLMNFRKGDAMLSATRTLLDGVGYARQLAISQHTTVYMVFVPPNVWANWSAYNNSAALGALPDPERAKLTNIVEKQLTGFTFVTLRSIGDQPGQNIARYLSEWRALPEKAFIADWKFSLPNTQIHQVGFDSDTGLPFPVRPFLVSTNFPTRGLALPFPSDDTPFTINPAQPWFQLPYIAFDYQGRLIGPDGTPLGRDEFIPLAHGSVSISTDKNKIPILAAPSILEQPPGNSTNTSYNLIRINWLTGRARLEHQQVK